MALVDAVVAVGEDEVTVDEGRAVGGVVGGDFEFPDEVVEPDDVGVGFCGFDEFGGGAAAGAGSAGVVAALVGEGSDIAGGESGGGEADEFAAGGHEVEAVALDVGGRAEAEVEVVEVFAGGVSRHGELPEEMSVLFVETEEDAAGTAVLGFAGVGVIGADEDAAVGDDGGAVGFVAELDGPFEVDRRPFLPGLTASGRPVSEETMLRSSWPANSGQSAARAAVAAIVERAAMREANKRA